MSHKDAQGFVLIQLSIWRIFIVIVSSCLNIWLYVPYPYHYVILKFEVDCFKIDKVILQKLNVDLSGRNKARPRETVP